MPQQITLTHINIRQSIVILVAKLIVVDVLAAVIILLGMFLIVSGNNLFPFEQYNVQVFLLLFFIVGFVKILSGIYIILLWLNEYYEITPESIIHRSGIIYRKSEKYDLGKVRLVEVNDSILGEYFNFATITLFDIRLQKYLDMYMVHNPKRYIHIIKALRSSIEFKEDNIRLPFKKREEVE